MKRVLPASPAVVFAAFTDATQLASWWGPSGFTIPSLEFDPHAGESYRIEMQPPEGDSFYLAGEFLEVEPPRRLAFTFAWEEPDPDDVETRVELAFRDLGDATEVALGQGPFSTKARRALHRDGWTDSFDKLERLLARPAAVDLYWLPLGAGGHFVRLNGRVYEALMARLQRRPACDLYHSALQVRTPEGTFVVEQAPVPDLSGKQRGVVAQGAVGSRWAARFRIFRYEIRLWAGGHIPDVAEAVDSPHRLSSDDGCAQRVLETVPQVPTPVWGRDELGTGEMWNSNAVIAWVIASSGLDANSIQPPTGGRAPGWLAGLEVARRQNRQ